MSTGVVANRATDGEIAVLNLRSARRSAWAQTAQDPGRPGLAESIIDFENLASQFLGDVRALGRLESLAKVISQTKSTSRAELICAALASAGHRFADARAHLARATVLGASPGDVGRQTLTVDQACGTKLDTVLAARRQIAGSSGKLEDLAPLGALLADLERFDQANAVYEEALNSYDDVSPFPLAWVCFQLGHLWGELVPEPDVHLAATWYKRALAYVPRYVHARVHLAEIYFAHGRLGDAEQLLQPALLSGDPEAPWRLADILLSQNKIEEAQFYLDAAHATFDMLLKAHILAYADHGVEFYLGIGNDPRRALELAKANVINRPTHHARDLLRVANTKAAAAGIAVAPRIGRPDLPNGPPTFQALR